MSRSWNEKKPYNKLNSPYKKLGRKERGAKEKQAIRENKDFLPRFRKSGKWDWF